MDYFSLIEAYFNGKLTGSELSDFLKEVQRNPDLVNQVEKYRKDDEIKKRQDLIILNAEYSKKQKNNK
jgi:hypothetical protein